MKVYFEYVLIDNVIINFLILLCVAKCLHYQYKKILLFLSSIVGGVVALVLPLFNVGVLLQISIKLILGCVMLLIAFKFKSFKKFLIGFLCFVSFTFLMGGACYALLLMFGKSIDSAFYGYDASIPLGLMLAIVATYVMVTIEIAKHIYKKRDACQFIGKIKIQFDNKSVECEGFVDSGNRLFDNVTGLPVIIVSTKVLKNLLSSEILTNIYFGKNNVQNKNFHFIQFATLSGNSKPMLVFKPQKVLFMFKGKTTECQVIVGITSSKFSDVVNYDALLHPSMLI